MLDPVIAAGMIFSLVVLMLIGGFVLLYPITRQLGSYLERRMLAEADPDEWKGQVRALTREVEALREEVSSLAERQEFTERLLERPGATSDDAARGR